MEKLCKRFIYTYFSGGQCRETPKRLINKKKTVGGSTHGVLHTRHRRRLGVSQSRLREVCKAPRQMVKWGLFWRPACRGAGNSDG